MRETVRPLLQGLGVLVWYKALGCRHGLGLASLSWPTLLLFCFDFCSRHDALWPELVPQKVGFEEAVLALQQSSSAFLLLLRLPVLQNNRVFSLLLTSSS